MDGILHKNRNRMVAFTLFLVLFSLFHCIIPSPAMADTSWEPRPPLPLNETQKAYYPDEDNWDKPLQAPVVLLVTITNSASSPQGAGSDSSPAGSPSLGQSPLYRNISTEARDSLGILGKLPKYPHLRAYATAGRIAILNPESTQPNAPLQDFFQLFNQIDCYSARHKCTPRVWSLFEAFGINRKHYSTTALKSDFFNAPVKQLNADNPTSFTVINQALKEALSHNTSLISTLNLEGDENNLASLDGLLAKLDERVIVYIANLPAPVATGEKNTGTNDHPTANHNTSKYGQIIAYNSQQGTGLLTSSFWDSPGLVSASGLQTEIIARLKLPSTQTSSGAPWGSFNPSYSGIINLEDTDLPASVENLNQELQILADTLNSSYFPFNVHWLILGGVIAGMILGATIILIYRRYRRPSPAQTHPTNQSHSINRNTKIPHVERRLKYDNQQPSSWIPLATSMLALITLFCLLASSLWAIAGGSGFPGKPSQKNTRELSTAQSTLVIYTSGIRWSDITAADSTKLQEIAKNAAVFNYLPPSPYSLSCPEDYWLALSAGNRVSRYSVSGRNLCANPTPPVNAPLPLWPYYKKMSRNFKPATAIGTLGEILSQNSIKVAAYGPYATLATVNKNGIPQADLRAPATNLDIYSQQLSQASSNYQLVFADIRGVDLNRNPERINYELKAQQNTLNKITNKLSWEKLAAAAQQNPNWNKRWPLYSPGSLNSSSLLTQTPVGKPLAEFSPNTSETGYYLATSPKDQLSAQKLYQELDNPPKLEFSSLQGIIYPDPSLSEADLIAFNKLLAPYQHNIKNPHYTDETAVDRLHRKQTNQQIAALTKVLTQLPKNINVVVLSGAADTEENTLQMGFIYGPDIAPGYLYSSSVNHQALGQTSDITASLIKLLALEKKKQLNLSGAPLQIAADSSGKAGWENRLYTLVDTEKRASVANTVGAGFYHTNALLIVFICLSTLMFLSLPIWLKLNYQSGIRRGGQSYFWFSLLRGLALFLIAIPAGAIITSALVNWWQIPTKPASYFLICTVCLALLLVILTELSWQYFTAKAAVICLCSINALLALADIVFGSRILLDSPISYHSLAGGRYYGMGNETYAIAATDLLIAMGLAFTPLLHKYTSRFAIILLNIPLLMAGIVFIIIDGAPLLGADFGGPVSFFPAFIILLLLVNQWRLRIKWLALIATLTILISALFAWLDYIRPANKRTHLGRFIQSALDGQLNAIIYKKLANNLNTLVASPHRIEFLFLLIVAVVIIRQLTMPPTCGMLLRSSISQQECSFFFRWQAPNWLLNHYSWLRPQPFEKNLWQAHPGLKEGTIAVAVCLTLGYALNDSGIDIPGLGLGQLIPTIMALGLAHLPRRYSL